MKNEPEMDKPDILEVLKELLLRSINDQGVKVYLFGSWLKKPTRTVLILT